MPTRRFGLKARKQREERTSEEVPLERRPLTQQIEESEEEEVIVQTAQIDNPKKKRKECGELQEKYHMEQRKDLWNKALGIVRTTTTKLDYDFQKGETFHNVFEQKPRRYVKFLDNALLRFRKDPEFGFLTDIELDEMTASISQEQMRNKIKRLNRDRF